MRWVGLVWLGLLGCTGEATSTPASKEPEAPAAATPGADLYDLAARAKDIDVIVISMDCLRYDRTGLADPASGRTPALQALAAESVVFHEAHSAAAWTVPGHMSIWTGRWPSRHGLVNKLMPDPAGGEKLVDAVLATSIPTYPEKLAAAGWAGAAFTGDAGVSARFGFGRGFSKFLDDKKFGAMDYSGPAAESWLKENKDGQFFLFFHGYDTHGQAPIPADALGAGGLRGLDPSYKGALDGSIEEQGRYREQALTAIKKLGDEASLGDTLSAADYQFLLRVYDKKIALADERVGAFVKLLKETGVWDHAIVAVVSDHGEEFGEHGALDHGYSLYEEQLHVPMMIHFPGQKERKDIREPVRTLDLFPTIFEALGLPALPEVDGLSLLPLLRGVGPAPAPVLAESDYRLFVHHRAIRKGKYKLILDLSDNQKRLYDLEADPGEETDLAEKEPRVAYELEQELRGHLLRFQADPNAWTGKKLEPITIY